jgi:hypothetical protein
MAKESKDDRPPEDVQKAIAEFAVASSRFLKPDGKEKLVGDWGRKFAKLRQVCDRANYPWTKAVEEACEWRERSAPSSRMIN